MNITETVKCFLEKYELENKKILAGFSGGYDSLCLLDILHKLGASITAIHLNHNWRGEESLRDEEFCRDYCQTNGIEFYTETLSKDVPHTEAAAREARYDFYKRCAEKFRADAIFTAHNLDDLAETVLYRIIKGTGVTGLQAISEKRGIVYRPLLDIPRVEIEKYCAQNNLKGIFDSSNDNVKYKRNFIRKKLMPLIAEVNPNYLRAFKNLSQNAEETMEIVDDYMAKISLETANITEHFIKLGAPLQNYLILDFFIKNNLEYDREKILSIVDFIKENASSKSGKTKSITTDLWIFVNSEKFEFIRKTGRGTIEVKITTEGRYDFGGYEFIIKRINENLTEFPKDSEMRAYAELEEINFTLRNRKDGDIIYPLGAHGSQKLKKYLNEKKIPNHEKDLIPLLCKGKEVLWAAGLGISEKIKVVNKPTHMIRLIKKEGQDEG